MRPFNASAIHFCQKNVSNRSHNIVRRGFQQVGEANAQLALPQPDGAVYIHKGKELYRDLRDGSAGTQLVITFLKDLKQAVTHRGFRLARACIHSGEVDLLLGFFFCFASCSCSASVLR